MFLGTPQKSSADGKVGRLGKMGGTCDIAISGNNMLWKQSIQNIYRNSPTLPPAIFSSGGYLQIKMFEVDLPRTIEALKEGIWNEVAAILLAVPRDVGSFRSRFEEFLTLNGHHFSDAIFKKY